MIQLYQVHKTLSVITYMSKISTEKDNVNVELEVLKCDTRLLKVRNGGRVTMHWIEDINKL